MASGNAQAQIARPPGPSAQGIGAPNDVLPDLTFVVEDLRRIYVRLADNLRWYQQTWLGAPIWQLPDDLIILQRIVFDAKPKWIIETGTKFGGSAIFFASLLVLIGRTAVSGGGVITVDINETAEARELLSEGSQVSHALASVVRQRIIGDAKAPDTLATIRAAIAADPGPVMVFLDDWHDGDHVYAELQEYSKLVSANGILIVADTVFEDLAGTPVVAPSPKYPEAKRSNPKVALRRFLAERQDFAVVHDYTSTGISNFRDGILKRTTFQENSPASIGMP